MIDFLFRRPSELLSVPPDQLKVIFCLLSAYPLSSLYTRLPTGTSRHLYSLTVAAFYLLGVLKLYGGVLHLLFASLGTYIIVIFDRSPRMPWVCFAFTMGHLMFNHIYRTLHAISPDVIEITGSQMVLVMKLITFAWNVHDGRRDINSLDAAQASTRLTRIPSLYSFLGWAFFFPTIIVGPSFDFSLYNSLVHNTLYLDPPTAKDPAAKKTIPPANPVGRKRVAYVHMVVGLAFLGFYAVLGSKATYAGVLSDAWYKDFSPIFRLLYVQASGFMARCKYYAVWELGEGAIILCGLGFNGYDSITGRARWNRCRNVDALRLETSESFKGVFDNWNMRTSVWLRETVYKRVSPKGKKPGFKSTLFTFVTSAFWHGTQPGYYLTFLHGALFTSLSKTFRRQIRPLLLPQSPSSSISKSDQMRSILKRLYDTTGWLCVQLSLNYFASSFLLLNFKDCMEFFRRTWWYGDIALVTSWAFFQFGGARKLKKLYGVPPPAPSTSASTAASQSVREAPSAGARSAPSASKLSTVSSSSDTAAPSGDEDWEVVQEKADPKGMGFGSLGEKVLRRASVTEE